MPVDKLSISRIRFKASFGQDSAVEQGEMGGE